MAVVKSFAVSDANGQQGDMFYIEHGTSNFTIIDCCLTDDNKKMLVSEIKEKSRNKSIKRFISTHPDEDHICGLEYLNEKVGLLNFYCVENNATKADKTDSFKAYCKLRDDKLKHFFVEAGCRRKWMNVNDENDGKNYGSSGINFKWPVISNTDYQRALKEAEEGKAYNNLSPVFTYSINGGATFMWMGDIESGFIEKVKGDIAWCPVDVLFAPHHGRKSGKLPDDVLKELNPKIIIIGEAPSENIDYYQGYNTLTQNSTGNITLECIGDMIHVFIEADSYAYDTSFLEDKNIADSDHGFYIGTIVV